MSRLFIVAALLATLVVGSNAVACKFLFQQRELAIDANQPKQVIAYNQLIDAARCCDKKKGLLGLLLGNPNDFKCNKNSGPVCGWDFEDYDNECDACDVGVQFTGRCKPQLNIVNCYHIPMSDFTTRVGCMFNALGTAVATVGLNAQPLDPTMLQPPCYVEGVVDKRTFRTVDGSCNNDGSVGIPGAPPGVSMSYSGMVGIKFVRHNRQPAPANIEVAVAAGPNPRVVSNLLFRRNAFVPNRANLNALAFSWLQFFIHDFFLHENDWQDLIAVPMPWNDPVWGLTDDGQLAQRYMYVPKTLPSYDSPTTGSRIHRNKVTSWFDASQVYGSEQDLADFLRTFENGRLKTSIDGFVPPLKFGKYSDNLANTPLFHCGDIRCNQHIGIQAMHNIFVIEHNNIATKLKMHYPELTDEQLYGYARLIVAAEIVKVQTMEISFALVDDPTQWVILQTIWQQAGTDPTPNPAATHTVPEDFIAAYKWHAMAPDQLIVRNPTTGAEESRIPYLDTFHNTEHIRTLGLGKTVASLGSQPAGAMRFNNYPEGLRNLRHPNVNVRRSNPFDNPVCVVTDGIDLGTFDIVRERERNVPKYNNYVRNLGSVVPPATNFAQLAETPAEARTLADLYDWNVENVDFIVGMLGADAEPIDAAPQAAIVGFLPFVYSRIKMDRFYTSSFNAATYTAWGFERIRGTSATATGVTFADILTENGILASVPASALGGGANMFKTWTW